MGPRRALVVFLPSSNEKVPISGTHVQLNAEGLVRNGTIDHGYIDFDRSIPQDTISKGTLTWPEK